MRIERATFIIFEPTGEPGMSRESPIGPKMVFESFPTANQSEMKVSFRAYLSPDESPEGVEVRIRKKGVPIGSAPLPMLPPLSAGNLGFYKFIASLTDEIKSFGHWIAEISQFGNHLASARVEIIKRYPVDGTVRCNPGLIEALI